MARTALMTIMVTPPCAFKASCPGATRCMEGSDECNGVTQEVTVDQQIADYMIIDGRIYWKLESSYEGALKKTQYYNCDVGDLSAINETQMFAETDAIDAMPETTQEEVDAKNLKYGIGFGENIFREEEIAFTG